MHFMNNLGEPTMATTESYLECTEPATVAWERLRKAPVSAAWSAGDEPEPALHRIHAYPAKFPAFLTGRALDYAAQVGLHVRRIGDLFCGCGTVAHEARRRGLAFWGCDINPVAILIAQAKCTPMDVVTLLAHSEAIVRRAPSEKGSRGHSPAARAYLLRWHGADHYAELARLLDAIDAEAPEGAERAGLLCAFSSILKGCSRWRAWSAKPSIDEAKAPAPPLRAFADACERLAQAHATAQWPPGPEAHLALADVRRVKAPTQRLQTLICSAPYGTSVDYVELHQLSAAWLGHHDQLTQLRRESIGSRLAGNRFASSHGQLNAVGRQVAFALLPRDPAAAAALSNYFVDMQQVAARSLDFLTPDGLAVFVVGNAQLRGVTIDNAAHLTEALLEAGFSRVRVARRRTSNKSTSPFRDRLGRLSREPTSIRQYEEEFVLIAHRGAA